MVTVQYGSAFLYKTIKCECKMKVNSVIKTWLLASCFKSFWFISVIIIYSYLCLRQNIIEGFLLFPWEKKFIFQNIIVYFIFNSEATYVSWQLDIHYLIFDNIRDLQRTNCQILRFHFRRSYLSFLSSTELC